LGREFDRAIAEYSEAIRLDPKNIAAFWGRCVAWTDRNALDRALADCDGAIAINARYARPYATRCIIWNNKRDHDRAAADCDQALRLDPRDALAHEARGVLLRGKRDYEGAIAELDEAIRLDPKLADAYHERGLALVDKRDYDRAIADYDEAIRLEPKFVRAYAARCWAWHLEREFDRALKDCDQAITLAPRLAFLFVRRGLIRVEQRDFDRAIADYGEALKLNPQIYEAYFRRGYAFRERREYDRAIADFDQAVRLNPKNPFAFNARGLAFSDKREYDRAIADFGEVVRLDPNFLAAFTNRGLAYERKGEADKARKDFETVLASPENQPGSGKWARDTARERLAALAGAQASARAAVAPEGPKKSAAPPPAAQAAVERGPRIALLVGNSTYQGVDPPLSQPTKDIRALAEELKHMGFETEIAENATKAGLQRAIDNFVKKVKPGSIALFYFGGYGIQVDRQTFLLPTDTQIWTEADTRRDGTNLETILDELSRQSAAVKLAIIDAARRNPYERRFRTAPAGLAPVSIAKNSLVIYSVGLGQTSNEPSGEQSLFVTELVKELRSPGISADEAFARTRIDVSRASDADQVPWVASSLVEGFYFVPSGGQPAARDGAR
jgi:tetratricopeptide (TPR) repeat protein